MPFRTRYLCLGVLSFLATNACAAEAPPMGWNPWNAFRTEVTEAKIMAVADTLVKTGLADAGYRYVNIDQSGPQATIVSRIGDTEVLVKSLGMVRRP